MLGLFIGLLTVVLVLDCLFLVLLVLVQLPKKEAGMGQAFGGAATDALFGAGSGNALTRMTKWCAGIFFALAILLTILANYAATGNKGGSRLQEMMNKAPAATPPPATAPATTPATGTNAPIKLDVPAVPVVPAVPAAPGTNAVPAK
jgi:preprotein translocase subunit SecG